MNSKDRVLSIFDRIDSEFEDLQRESNEHKERADEYYKELYRYVNKHNRFLDALKIRLLPKILENKSIMETWIECFELLNTKENE